MLVCGPVREQELGYSRIVTATTKAPLPQRLKHVRSRNKPGVMLVLVDAPPTFTTIKDGRRPAADVTVGMEYVLP